MVGMPGLRIVLGRDRGGRSVNDLARAVEGPVANIPILEQVFESVFAIYKEFPRSFEFRIYVTNELYRYIINHVTVDITDPARLKIWGIPIYRTGGEGMRWWVGVPGFVIPKMEEDER